MPKDTKTLGYIKAPACESRGFVIYKKRVHHFDFTFASSDFQLKKYYLMQLKK